MSALLRSITGHIKARKAKLEMEGGGAAAGGGMGGGGGGTLIFFSR